MRISIHKALAGLDETKQGSLPVYGYFNPQGPRGPRHVASFTSLIFLLFQSTRPSRASTYSPYIPLAPSHISIHKALAGLDLPERLLRPCSSYFNPQGPRGPRQHYPRHTLKRPLFQSTRPSRASTKLQSGNPLIQDISIHKALAGLDVIERK